MVLPRLLLGFCIVHPPPISPQPPTGQPINKPPLPAHLKGKKSTRKKNRMAIFWENGVTSRKNFWQSCTIAPPPKKSKNKNFDSFIFDPIQAPVQPLAELGPPWPPTSNNSLAVMCSVCPVCRRYQNGTGTPSTSARRRKGAIWGTWQKREMARHTLFSL